jgi:hypothetical protein
MGSGPSKKLAFSGPRIPSLFLSERSMASESFTALLNCCRIGTGMEGSWTLTSGSSHSTCSSLCPSSQALHVSQLISPFTPPSTIYKEGYAHHHVTRIWQHMWTASTERARKIVLSR